RLGQCGTQRGIGERLRTLAVDADLEAVADASRAGLVGVPRQRAAVLGGAGARAEQGRQEAERGPVRRASTGAPGAGNWRTPWMSGWSIVGEGYGVTAIPGWER